MKRIIAFICTFSLVVLSVCISPIAADASEIFEDTLMDFNSVSEKIGDWDCFPEHSEFGLSVAGRKTVTGENSLIYGFPGKAVTSLQIKLVEYSGFFSASDYRVCALVNSSWTELSVTASAESDISGHESLNFKSVTLTADSVPEGAVSVKITLRNGVAWTLFIDHVTAELTDYAGGSGSGDVQLQYTDELDSLETNSYSEGEWVSFANHPEFGKSVAGRAGTDSENNIYYLFSDGEISSVHVDLVIYHGFFGNSDIELSVRNSNDSEWSTVSFSVSAEKDITGHESAAFKSVSLKASTVPDGMTQLRISFKNQVTYTMFLDRVQVIGCSALKRQEQYNENLFTFTDSAGTQLDYYLVTPDDYDPERKYPLVLFMHGVGGETDQSGYTHLRDRLFKNDFDCIFLAPLAKRDLGQWWVSYEDVLYDNEESAVYNQDEIVPTAAFQAARSLLVKIENDYPVNTSQIYVLGVSMGGYATWELITRYPEMFSAAVPICGGNDPTKAEKIVDLPIWTFHGDQDAAVAIDATRAMVEALKELGSTVVRYTEYAGLDHGIWFKVFDEPEMLPWLFSQSRATTIPDLPDTPGGSEVFTDPMESFDLMASHTDGWDLFNPHPETNLSVAGRSSADKNAAAYYRFDGKNIVSLKLSLQYAPDYADIANDLVVEVRSGDADEWKRLSLKTGDSSQIGSSVFYLTSVSAESFPENISEVRLTLKNETLWGLFIDEVKLGLVSSSTPSQERQWSVIDGLDNYDYISNHSNNLQLFTPHPETGLNVLAKKNAKRGYISYCFNGGLIQDFKIQLQIGTGFFVQERDLLIQYRLKGSENFETVTLLCDRPSPINETFSLLSVTPEGKLPDQVEELKISLYNDVAWTLMLDEVRLSVDGGEIPTSIPKTGERYTTLAAVLNLMLASAFVMLTIFKRRITC